MDKKRKILSPEYDPTKNCTQFGMKWFGCICQTDLLQYFSVLKKILFLNIKVMSFHYHIFQRLILSLWLFRPLRMQCMRNVKLNNNKNENKNDNHCVNGTRSYYIFCTPTTTRRNSLIFIKVNMNPDIPHLMPHYHCHKIKKKKKNIIQLYIFATFNVICIKKIK